MARCGEQSYRGQQVGKIVSAQQGNPDRVLPVALALLAYPHRAAHPLRTDGDPLQGEGCLGISRRIEGIRQRGQPFGVGHGQPFHEPPPGRIVQIDHGPPDGMLQK